MGCKLTWLNPRGNHNAQARFARGHASRAPARVYGRRAHLLMRPRVARTCSRVRVSPPPARVCGRRLRLRICTRVSPAHYARVCMRGRAPTHPLPPPPMGVGVASKHQAPSQEPTFTLYYLRKSAPKKLKTHFPIFYTVTDTFPSISNSAYRSRREPKHR